MYPHADRGCYLQLDLNQSVAETTGGLCSAPDASLRPRRLLGEGVKNPAAPAVKREAEEDWG
jgi:hypothetical protein